MDTKIIEKYGKCGKEIGRNILKNFTRNENYGAESINEIFSCQGAMLPIVEYKDELDRLHITYKCSSCGNEVG